MCTKSCGVKTLCDMRITAGHCCITYCFNKVSNYVKLEHISIHWYSTKKYEIVLRRFLNKVKLDDITIIIMQYLHNYKSTGNNFDPDDNYRAYIRSSLLVITVPH